MVGKLLGKVVKKVGEGPIGRRVITSKKGDMIMRKLNKLETEIRSLSENRKELTTAQKEVLAKKEAEVKVLTRELREEKNKADTKGQITRAGKKEFKGYTPSSPFNKGGMPSRNGNYDMRKGGMFMKGTK